MSENNNDLAKQIAKESFKKNIIILIIVAVLGVGIFIGYKLVNNWYVKLKQDPTVIEYQLERELKNMNIK